MTKMHRLFAAAGLVLVLVVAVPVSALAWNSTCNSGEMCNWKNGPMVNPKAASSSSDANYVGDVYPGTSSSLNDSVSSIRNLKTGNDVVWYFDKNYRWTSFCLDAGWEAAYLGTHNDRYSSHQVVSNGTC